MRTSRFVIGAGLCLVLEPSQQPTCHIALKNWGLSENSKMLEGHRGTEV